MLGGRARTAGAVLAVALLATSCRSPAEPRPDPADAHPPTPVPSPVTPVPTAPEAAVGGALRFAITEPATVPFESGDPDSLVVVDTLFDSLTAWDPSLVVVPAAARSWDSDDGRVWRFHLREGATFHDGTPVTADDFKFTWELAVRDGDAGFHLRHVEGYAEFAAGHAEGLAGVQAVDAETLLVRLSEPYGRFPSVVAHPTLAPVPRERWEADPAGFRRQPVGNGPFMAAEAVAPGRFLRVQRFDAWGNGTEPARLDEVLFQFMDPDTAFVAFQQGRLQVSTLPEGAAALARERYGQAADGYRGSGVVDGLRPTVYFLGFDVTAEPFDEPEVRRAVSLAIDRERLVTETLGGDAVAADGLVAPVLSSQRAPCTACVHDPEAASAIFAEHGVESVTLWFNQGGGHRAIADRVRADLVAAGVERVTFRTEPFAQWMEALREGDAALFRFGWQPEYPLVDDVLHPLFHSSGIPRSAGEDAADEEAAADSGADPPEGEEAAGEPAEDASNGEPADGESIAGDLTAADPDADAGEAPDADPGAGSGEEPDAEAPDGSGHNYMRYADEEVDRLLAEARATTSGMRRSYYHWRAEDLILNRDQAVVPLFFYRHRRVVDERVVGFTLNPMGLVDLSRVLLRPDGPEPTPTPTGRPLSRRRLPPSAT